MDIHQKKEDNLKYTCKICSAQYGRRFALNDHIKAEHPESDEVYVIEELQPVGADEEIYSVVISHVISTDGEESNDE
jgi:hypothetical protein